MYQEKEKWVRFLMGASSNIFYLQMFFLLECNQLKSTFICIIFFCHQLKKIIFEI